MSEPINVVMLGGGAVGKSSITVQFCYKKFEETYDPTLEDSYTTHIEIDGTTIEVNILDTAGQEEYCSLRDNYMREGDGFVLVYSIVDNDSYKEIVSLREQLFRTLDLENGKDHIPMVLIGNKCDLEKQRNVTSSAAQSIANEWKIPFIEVSAKQNINVDKLFTMVVKEIYGHKSIKKGVKKGKKKGKCSLF